MIISIIKKGFVYGSFIPDINKFTTDGNYGAFLSMTPSAENSFAAHLYSRRVSLLMTSNLMLITSERERIKFIFKSQHISYGIDHWFPEYRHQINDSILITESSIS